MSSWSFGSFGFPKTELQISSLKDETRGDILNMRTKS